ncbi:MAG: carboxypeptidase-like regulatory domain-containing protein [Terracidiphilus sp.]
MRFTRLQNLTLALSLVALFALVAITAVPVAQAQSITTGALAGVVLDASGAVVTNATVTLVDTATGAKQSVTTNSIGRYTIPSLRPGVYRVTASGSNMRSDTTQVTVILGTTATADITVTPTGSSTIVEVHTSDLPLVDTQNIALASTFSEEQIAKLPTPGGDVTTVAYTAPGVVVNAGGGGAGGNFSSDGLPGISNLFVLNGFDNQDPFLNLNNSGSSNLTLGQGELADATVIQNAYNSQYGRAAGAIISYTTKSGGNQFHGEAVYDYNGTVLNANGWFNQAYGQARPHAVSNEWALNGGGPIIKNKLFFFSDYEGLHYVLPASGPVSMPTAAYENYALANIKTLQGNTAGSPGAATLAAFNQMFGLYNASPVYPKATAVPTGTIDVNGNASATGGCGQLLGLTNPVDGNYFGAVPYKAEGTADSCALNGYANANNINIEWLFTQRIDWNISEKHKVYGRFKMDHGSQPTNTNLVNPAFNTVSIQPEYEGQFNDAYSISSNVVNTAVVAANWYTAYFGPADTAKAQAALPFWAYFNIGADGSGTSSVPGFTNLGVPDYFPQGRNITQYQIEDDLSWIHGKHNFKFGVNFRRDLASDYDAREIVDFGFMGVYSLGDLATGSLSANPCPLDANNNPIISTNCQVFAGGNEYQQAFDSSATAHLALYNMGLYIQDDWQMLNKLKLTLGVRVDRTGDPTCGKQCFSLYNGLPASTTTVPFNSLINAQNTNPYGSEKMVVQPRLGFNYELDAKTGIRGGIGLFADLYPAGFLDGPIENFPNYNLESIYGGNIALGGTGSAPGNAIAGNTAVQAGFGSGGSATTINTALNNLASAVPYSPPSLNAVFAQTFHEPQYVEYSIQIQRQLGKSDGVSLTYAGNYGYNEIMQNPYANASTGIFSSALASSPTASWLGVGCASGSCATLGNLAAAPPNQSFSEINTFTNDARSNYNGGMAMFTHQGNGLTAHATFTWSHTLDDVSNSGLGQTFGQANVTKQLTPSLAAQNLNYSNADYDIRKNFSADFVYEEPFKTHNPIANILVSGWMVSGKIYYRTGEPISINNNNFIGLFPTMSAVNNTAGSSSIMPEILVPQSKLTNNCINFSHATVAGDANGSLAVPVTCLDPTQYVSFTKTNGTQSSFGNLRRNALYGPHYADVDAVLNKQVMKRGTAAFEIGAQFYNLLNHANFLAPGVGNTSAFGTISTVQGPPTSPYGSFQSAAVTQRVVVVTGKITF